MIERSEFGGSLDYIASLNSPYHKDFFPLMQPFISPESEDYLEIPWGKFS